MTTIYIVTASWHNDFTGFWLVKAFKREDTAIQFIKDNKNSMIDYEIEEVCYE